MSHHARFSFPSFFALALKYVRNIGNDASIDPSMASSVLRSMRAESNAGSTASFRPRRLFNVFAWPFTPFMQAASVSLTDSQAMFSAS